MITSPDELDDMMQLKRVVMMGDPKHFTIQGGANPHTRDRWGRRKRVNHELAVEQWHTLARCLTELGVVVWVVPPVPEQPGTVYPANAGMLTDVWGHRPIETKRFLLSQLVPTRAGETPHYHQFLTSLGIECREAPCRFEGEADCFPVGERYLVTWGHIRQPRLVPRMGWPPYRRVFGFRTEHAATAWLRVQLAPRELVVLELALDRHYHGDTVACTFGPEREYLLVYLEGFTEPSRALLWKTMADRVVPIEAADAKRFAANAIQIETSGGPVLVLPDGTSETLQQAVRDRGVRPLLVNVSEFMTKGGGSVKCMIGDLGWAVQDETTLPAAVRRVRRERQYTQIWRGSAI